MRRGSLINNIAFKPKLAFFVNNEATTEDYSEKKLNEKDPTIQDEKFIFLKRKKKAEKEGRDFKCTICDISYFSYPALYTHHRNKHSLIPITNKKNYFKSSLTTNSKFKYTKMDQQSDLVGLSDLLMKYYQDIFTKYSKNLNSLFYSPLSVLEYDEFYLMLQNLRFLNKGFDSEEKLKQSTIEDILVIYLTLMMKITKEEKIIKLLVLFVYLVKEFLGLFGWEYNENMANVGIRAKGIKDNSSFLKNISCEDFPDLMNDFSTTFLLIEPEIAEQQGELTDICHNFCLWLVSQKLTSFHLVRISD